MTSDYQLIRSVVKNHGKEYDDSPQTMDVTWISFETINNGGLT